MPSYEECQHCSHSVRTSEVVFHEGYSYHRHCRRCYVCSETNLQGAEVFRGVIFCTGCAKRIFRGCSTARQAKQPRPRRRTTRTRRVRAVEHGIIARAQAGSKISNSTSSIAISKAETAVPTREPRVCQECYCVSDIVTQARRLINFICYQTQNLIKNDTAEIAQCTEVCQRMLEELMCPVPEPRPVEPQTLTAYQQSTKRLRKSVLLRESSTDVGTVHSRSRFCSKRRAKKNKKIKKSAAPPCSDLRIAELGASVEIANMALRRVSTKKVESESLVIAEKPRTVEKTEPETISMFSNLDSVHSNTSNEEYLDSVCQDYRESNEMADRCIWDQIFKGVVKTPCEFFKKRILRRSSLISVFIGVKNEKKSFSSAYKRFKMLFHDDIIDHQQSGYQKLYKTINKKNKPFRLGWLDTDVPGDRKTSPCRHYHQCHSYRCMRTQVMRLAGPTESKMYCFRTRVKKIVVPPFLRNLSFQYKSPAMMPEICGTSDSRVTKTSRSSEGQPKSLESSKRPPMISRSSQIQPKTSRSTGQPKILGSSEGQPKTLGSSEGQPKTSGSLRGQSQGSAPSARSSKWLQRLQKDPSWPSHLFAPLNLSTESLQNK